MEKKNTVVVAIVVALAVIGIFAVSLQTSTIETKDSTLDTASTTAWLDAPAEKQSTLELSTKTVITAKHALRDGLHIVAGEVPLPTPCHILESSASVSDDKKMVFLALASSVKTGEVCASVITPARFKISARADKAADISATLNGQSIILNLIEAGPNEDLDSFDLYIKG